MKLPRHLRLVIPRYAWLDLDIVQHRLQLNPSCSPIKQKPRRMKPEMSLKIKEEVKK